VGSNPTSRAKQKTLAKASVFCYRLVMEIKRVSVIGISASGKSTFARELAQQIGLPLFHMDQLFWKNDWQEVPESEYLKEHQKLIDQDRWIIEGYIDTKMADRLRRSDLIIFLDYPGWLCTWRVLKRYLMHRNESRPELPTEAKEKLDFVTLWKIFRRKERIPLIDSLRVADPANLKVIKRPSELRELEL
jgi:adenylate kinase family enzyme